MKAELRERFYTKTLPFVGIGITIALVVASLYVIVKANQNVPPLSQIEDGVKCDVDNLVSKWGGSNLQYVKFGLHTENESGFYSAWWSWNGTGNRWYDPPSDGIPRVYEFGVYDVGGLQLNMTVCDKDGNGRLSGKDWFTIREDAGKAFPEDQLFELRIYTGGFPESFGWTEISFVFQEGQLDSWVSSKGVVPV